MHQFVIYLKRSNNDLVYQDSFQVGETVHCYQAIRLWEQPSEAFLQSPGLLPLAVLTQTSDPALKLREVATALEQIEDNRVKANLMAATSVFGGILLAPELIKTILRSEIMKESAVYQEILEEGKIAGKLEGRLEG